MAGAWLLRASPSALTPPGCCVTLQATGRVAGALGLVALGLPTPTHETILVVVAGLPPPQDIGASCVRYQVWVYGGGSLRLGIALRPGPGPGLFAGGLGPLTPGPWSEIALTPEPRFSATPSGPVLLAASFAYCR